MFGIGLSTLLAIVAVWVVLFVGFTGFFRLPRTPVEPIGDYETVTGETTSGVAHKHHA